MRSRNSACFFSNSGPPVGVRSPNAGDLAGAWLCAEAAVLKARTDAPSWRGRRRASIV